MEKKIVIKLFNQVYKVLRFEDNQHFAAKIYHKEKLEENKYKDKFVVIINI